MQRLRQGCREINWPAAAALFFLWMMATFPAGGWTLDSSQCFHVALNTLCKEQQIEEKFFMVHCRSTDMHATKTFASWYNVLCLVKIFVLFLKLIHQETQIHKLKKCEFMFISVVKVRDTRGLLLSWKGIFWHMDTACFHLSLSKSWDPN